MGIVTARTCRKHMLPWLLPRAATADNLTSPDHNSIEPTISLAHPSPNHHSSNHVSPANNSASLSFTP
ncbi:hypothetical protein YC2023_057775 [Brassica napus]